MKCLSFACLINSRFGILTGASKVSDMPKQVPRRILHSQCSEVNPDPEKCNCRFASGPSLDRQSANDHEPSAIQHLVQ